MDPETKTKHKKFAEKMHEMFGCKEEEYTEYESIREEAIERKLNKKPTRNDEWRTFQKNQLICGANGDEITYIRCDRDVTVTMMVGGTICDNFFVKAGEPHDLMFPLLCCVFHAVEFKTNVNCNIEIFITNWDDEMKDFLMRKKLVLPRLSLMFIQGIVGSVPRERIDIICGYSKNIKG